MATRNIYFGTASQGKISYDTTTGNFTLGNSNEELLHINSNKNVGVGFATNETVNYRLDVSGGAINTDTDYNINGTKVLDATSLGNGVVNSSLTSVGTLNELTVSGNTTLNGDLTVNGTVTSVNTENMTVEDPLIQLAKGNVANAVDIGLFGSYNDGTDKYTGMYRDSTDGIIKFFTELTEQPTTTVNTAGIGYTEATILVGDVKTTTVNATGNVQASSLDVTNNSTVGGTFDVTGNTTLSTVSTSGQATLNSTDVTNNATVGGTLGVTGDTTLTTMTASGAVQANSLGTTGDINTLTGYNVSGVQVLSSNTIGSGVVNSSLQNLGIQNADLNMGTQNITNATSISATNVTGTLQTAAQPNITSVGTLAGLNVNGTANLTTTNSYQINNTSVLNETTLGSGVVNSSIQNLGTQNADLNMGTQNITNATSVSATNVNATNVTGTLQTAAQPNVTSVGTLSSLNVSGNVAMDTDTLVVDSTNNNVGIGIAAPDSKLHIIDDTDNQADETGIHAIKVSTGALGQAMMMGYDGDDNLSYINSGNTTGTTNLVLQSRGGNVGIGVTNPTHELEVGGNINFTGNLYKNGTIWSDGLWEINGDEIYNDNIGNVVVGGTTGTSKLHVVGDVNTTTDYKVGASTVLNATTLGGGVVNSSLQNLGTQNADLNMGTQNITNATSVSATNVTGTLQTAAQPNITSVGTLTSGIWNATSIDDAYITSASTWNSKQNALTFGISNNNSIVIDDVAVSSGDYAVFTTTGLQGKTISEVKTDLSLDNVENTALSTYINSLTVDATPDGSSDYVMTYDASAGSQKKVLLNNLPGGGGGGSGNSIEDTDNTTSITTQETAENIIMKTNSVERVRVDSSGNVGIGKSVPESILHIYKDENPSLIIEDGRSGASGFHPDDGEYGNITFVSGDTSLVGGKLAKIGVINDGGGTFPEGALALSVGINGGLNESVRLASDGNVGIGTVAPSKKLEVNGTFNATANNGYTGMVCSFSSEKSGTNIANGTSLAYGNGGSNHRGIVMPSAGTIIGMTTSTSNSSYYQLELYKNYSATGQIITQGVNGAPPTTATSKVDNSYNYSFAAGDVFKLQVSESGTGADDIVATIFVKFD